jgi:Nucleotide modification associated domain 2
VRVFSYVMVVDDGGAPNFEAPFTTLAVCKPRIRLSAQPGDLVIGFSGQPLSSEPNAVRWAGIVCERLPFADYWNDARFENKKPGIAGMPDNFYQPVRSELVQVENSFTPAWRGARIAEQNARAAGTNRNMPARANAAALSATGTSRDVRLRCPTWVRTAGQSGSACSLLEICEDSADMPDTSMPGRKGPTAASAGGRDEDHLRDGIGLCPTHFVPARFAGWLRWCDVVSAPLPTGALCLVGLRW